MEKRQSNNEIVDISNWQFGEEYPHYPEGARSKTLLYSPSNHLYGFLKSGYPYLFKLSSHRYPEQFWVEIFAYQLGLELGIQVPRSFVAMDRRKGIAGALIEWFFEPEQEIFKPGGDFFVNFIPDFDRSKGRQHNFETIAAIFKKLGNEHPEVKETWLPYWAQVFLFDALIGNTDRHQDNWGIILNREENKVRLAPAFDNGTSMGHEIRSDKFFLANNKNWMEIYIGKGYHHVRWHEKDRYHAGHIELLSKLVAEYPETKKDLLNCFHRINLDNISDILNNLCSFHVSDMLTKERSFFMFNLLKARCDKILSEIER